MDGAKKRRKKNTSQTDKCRFTYNYTKRKGTKKKKKKKKKSESARM